MKTLFLILIFILLPLCFSISIGLELITKNKNCFLTKDWFKGIVYTGFGAASLIIGIIGAWYL